MFKEGDFTQEEYQILETIQGNQDLFQKILQALENATSNFDGSVIIKELFNSYFPEAPEANVDWESISMHIKEYQMHTSSMQIYSVPRDPDRFVETPEWVPEEEPLFIPEEFPEEAPAEPEREPEREPEKVGEVALTPCPTGEPRDPDRFIETPEWKPDEEPLTIPETFPEEAPVEPQREPEKVPARFGSEEDIPKGVEKLYSAPIAYKVVKAASDGTLISPSQGTRWPVGEPLIEPNFKKEDWIDPETHEFRRDRGTVRGNIGIHIVLEGHWDELYGYTGYGEDFILLKVRCYNGLAIESNTGKGLCGGALPILAIGTNKALLAKIEEKYNIDVIDVNDNKDNDDSPTVYENDDFEVYGPGKGGGTGSYKGFDFTQKSQSRYEDKVYEFEAIGNQFKFASLVINGNEVMSFSPTPDDYGTHTVDLGDRTLNIDDAIYEFVNAKFQNELTYNEHWGEQYLFQEWIDNESEIEDYEGETESIDDWESLVKIYTKLESYDRDDYTEYHDIEQDPIEWRRDNEVDHRGIFGFHEVRYIQPPTKIEFDKDAWLSIFEDLIEYMLKTDQYNQEDTTIAQALIEVPKFIQQSEYQEWDGDINLLHSWAIGWAQDKIDYNKQMGESTNAAEQFLEAFSGGLYQRPPSDQQRVFEYVPEYNKWERGEDGNYQQVPVPAQVNPYPDIQEDDNLGMALGSIKEADYFYDWQGYYPDDGSLNDGVAQNGSPAPSFFNMPDRCPQCDHDSPAGHLINFDEVDKKEGPTSKCQNCGYAYPMEYDNLSPSETGVGQRWNVLNRVARGNPITDYARQNGWEFEGTTSNSHQKWYWTAPDGQKHMVLISDPKKAVRQPDRAMQNAIGQFNSCMRGTCTCAQYRLGVGPHAPKQFTQKAPIINGPTGEQYFQLQRGMSDREYKRWSHGEMITAGKYFTTAPRTFNVHSALVKQTDEHTFTLQQNAMLGANDFIDAAGMDFNQIAPTQQLLKGTKFESQFYTPEIARRIAATNLREFPNYYDKIGSDEDKFSEVDLQNVPNGPKPTRDMTMPNRLAPSFVEINKKQRPNPQIHIIEPDIVAIPAELHDKNN